jgi:hypothetical protein
MHKFEEEQLGRAAGRIWSEGRANPVDWEIRTALGMFTTDDRSTWGPVLASGRLSCADPGMAITAFSQYSRGVSTAAAMTRAAGTQPLTASECGSCARTSFRWQRNGPAYEFGRGGCAASRPLRASGRAHLSAVKMIMRRRQAAEGSAEAGSSVTL